MMNPNTNPGGEIPPCHLTYCLNVHPGESWAENLAAIRTAVPAVRERVAAGRPFGLGLRLSRRAAETLRQPAELEAFRGLLREHDLYVFTINGFPYGEFHGTPVKENVYRPDWRSPERCEYTRMLIEILAALVPEGVSGSISTVPGSYAEWIRTPADRALMARNLADCAKHCRDVEMEKGRHIHIGLEPEPDCFLENTAQTLAFFAEDLMREGCARLTDAAGLSMQEAGQCIRRHVGVCFDTCHLALQYESLAGSLARFAEAGVKISKMQISAALRTACTASSVAQLRPFADGVYLHQVKARERGGAIVSRGDLPVALQGAAAARDRDAEWRVHCHVPLYFTGGGELQTTATELTPEFFQAARRAGVEHFEVETYTFDVLPAELRERGVVDSIADELRWAQRALGGVSDLDAPA